MGTPLSTRVRLKLNKIARDLSPAEREFRRVWLLIDSVEGFLLEGEEKWLFKRARSLPDGANLVEIGSYRGRSTSCLAFGCRGTKKHVYAVDSFDGNVWESQYRSPFNEFEQNIKRCELSSYVEPVRGLSGEVAKSWSKSIQFLFIDGSHVYEDVLGDFASFLPHVVPGGIIAFHDVCESKPGVWKAWNEIIKQQLTNVGYCSSIGYGRKPKGKITPA
jgi:hypothetical protein